MQVDQISADQNGLMNYKEHWAVAPKRIIANHYFLLLGSSTSKAHLKGKAIFLINSDKTLTFRAQRTFSVFQAWNKPGRMVGEFKLFNMQTRDWAENFLELSKPKELSYVARGKNKNNRVLFFYNNIVSHLKNTKN